MKKILVKDFHPEFKVLRHSWSKDSTRPNMHQSVLVDDRKIVSTSGSGISVIDYFGDFPNGNYHASGIPSDFKFPNWKMVIPVDGPLTFRISKKRLLALAADFKKSKNKAVAILIGDTHYNLFLIADFCSCLDGDDLTIKHHADGWSPVTVKDQNGLSVVMPTRLKGNVHTIMSLSDIARV